MPGARPRRHHEDMSPLISASDLAALRASGTHVRLLDVRWRLDQPEGRPDYLDGHLPDAVYVDLENELSRRGEPDEGSHPVPSRAALQAAARRWGIRPGDVVVAYDDLQGVAAARAWWLLTRHGVPGVRVLDGGLRAWLADGERVATGDILPAPGTIELTEPADGIVRIAQLAAWPEEGVVLDVRAPEHYRGVPELRDPVGGHVPGAVNLPTTVHLSGGRFQPPEVIRAAFAAAGARPGIPIAAYCGSGIRAAHTALAGAIAGLDVAVFPGSWNQWARTRRGDIATGPLPAGAVRR